MNNDTENKDNEATYGLGRVVMAFNIACVPDWGFEIIGRDGAGATTSRVRKRNGRQSAYTAGLPPRS